MIKKIFLLIFVLTFSINLFGQEKNAEQFIEKLKNNEKLSSLFCDNWTLKYYRYNGNEGLTEGEMNNLSKFQIDSIIKLQVKNDGNLAFFKQKAKKYILKFNLKKQVKDWKSIEVSSDKKKQKDDYETIEGDIADYFRLYYNDNKLIIKLEYIGGHK